MKKRGFGPVFLEDIAMDELTEVIAKKLMHHDQLGTKQKGQKFKVTPRQMKQLLSLGVIDVPVEVYETKVVTSHPLSGLGEVAQSSVSPAAPASHQTTSNQSRRGAKRQRDGE